ncbi:MAG: hypothetical protein HQL87_17680, partial [Magnetococcales bacterium]|nr:hypothetical protein [Magnetococcales bacterium]
MNGVAAGINADSKVIDFTAEGGQVDIITGTGHVRTLDMNGDLGVLVRASASGQLNVGNFVDLSGSLGFERRVQAVVLADGTSVQTQMLSVGGTGLTGFVGLGPYATDNNGNGIIDRDANGVILTSELNPAARGIAVRGVEFGLGLFSSTDSGYSNTHWTALTANIGYVDTLVGLPTDITFQIRDLGVDINLVSGLATGVDADSKVINFAGTRTVDGVDVSNAVTLITGTGKSLDLTHDGSRGQMIRASGGMTLDAAGFFMVSGTMAMEKSSQKVTLADGSQVNTDLLTIGGTGLSAFVGVNGPYRRDTNGDGVIDLDDKVNLDAVGLTLTEAEFGLSMLYEKTGSRHWIALEASALEVGLVGVFGVTATAQNLSVGINQVYGVATGSDPNTQVIDFSGDKALTVYTGYGETMKIDLAGSKGALIQASGDFALSIADFVTVRGSLAFEKSIGSIQVANGTSYAVDTLRVGGTGISAFAGVGGPYFVDSNGDGRIVVSGANADVPNRNATGFALTNAEFALAIASTPEGATKLSGVTWLGLALEADSVAFVGVDAITMAVSHIQVEVNQVYGLAPELDSIDYVARFDKMADPANHLTPMTVSTGPTTSRTLMLDGDKGPLLRASADVQIGLDGFFYAGGSLGFEKSVRTLTLANGAQVSHDVLTVGGSNLQAFAGIHGGPAETLGNDAVGFLLSGVEFGLVVASEREVLTQTLSEDLTWKGVAISDYRLVDGVRIEGGREVAISNGSTGSNIWISEDQGLSWQAVPLGAQGLNFSGVTISADGQEIVCVVSDGGVLTSKNGGRDWFYDTSITDSYTAVALTQDGEIITADQRSKRQFDVLFLETGNDGGLALNDTITIKGLSDESVVYTVVAEDLTSDGAKSTTTATPLEASTNVAKKLAKALNDATGGLATATANGNSIELVAKGSDSQAGWYDINVGVQSKHRVFFLTGSREAVPSRGIGQVDSFKITGTFAVGDIITMQGITDNGSILTYTVTDNDLKVDRKADGKKATSEQVWTNVMNGINAFFAEPVEIPKAIQRLAGDIATLNALNLFGNWDAELLKARGVLQTLLAYRPPALHSIVKMGVADGMMVFTGLNGSPPYNLDIQVFDKNAAVKTGNKVLSSEGNSSLPQRGNLRITASLQDLVNITGNFSVGDVITLEGITPDRPFLSYTVTANDLLANGGPATPEQVRVNVMVGIQKIFDEPAERIRLINDIQDVLNFLYKL